MPPAMGCRSASIPVKATGIFFFPNALFINRTERDGKRRRTNPLRFGSACGPAGNITRRNGRTRPLFKKDSPAFKKPIAKLPLPFSRRCVFLFPLPPKTFFEGELEREPFFEKRFPLEKARYFPHRVVREVSGPAPFGAGPFICLRRSGSPPRRPARRSARCRDVPCGRAPRRR